MRETEPAEGQQGGDVITIEINPSCAGQVSLFRKLAAYTGEFLHRIGI